LLKAYQFILSPLSRILIPSEYPWFQEFFSF
jgi:hypothetical protein